MVNDDSLRGKKKNILFTCKNMGSFSELLHLAVALKKTGGYEPFFYLHRSKGNCEIFVPKCKEAGIRYGLGRNARLYLSGVQKSFRPKKINNPTLRFLYNKYWRVKERIFLKIYNFFTAAILFLKVRPRLIVLDSAAGSDLNLYNYFKFLGRIIKAPNIVYTWALMLDQNPLEQIFGSTDYVLASSQCQKDIIVQGGVPVEKIIVTGKVVEDPIAQILGNIDALRNDLRKSVGASANAKIILYAVAPDVEEDTFAEKEHFALVERLIQMMLGQKNTAVFLNLHYRVDKNKYDYLEKKFPIKILKMPCASAIALSEIFIAYTSSVVRIALMCGVPTISFNYVKVSHNIYKKEHGFFETASEDELREMLGKFLDSQDFFEMVKKRMKVSADYFGFTDGKSGERAIDFIDKITH